MARPFARMVFPQQRQGSLHLLPLYLVNVIPVAPRQVDNGALQLWARHENITDPQLKKMGYANFSTSAMASQAAVRYL